MLKSSQYNIRLYTKLLTVVQPQYRPSNFFNKHIDEYHDRKNMHIESTNNKLDLKYIDSIGSADIYREKSNITGGDEFKDKLIIIV